MDYTNMRMLDLYDRIISHAKPGAENNPIFIEGRQHFQDLKKSVTEDAREHLDILEDCCDDVTAPPWCGFSDDGKTWAIMAAGRPGDVFKFEEPPKEADVHYLLLAQPHVIKAMIQRIRHLETLADVDAEHRWTIDKPKEKNDGDRADEADLAE